MVQAVSTKGGGGRLVKAKYFFFQKLPYYLGKVMTFQGKSVHRGDFSSYNDFRVGWRLKMMSSSVCSGFCGTLCGFHHNCFAPKVRTNFY